MNFSLSPTWDNIVKMRRFREFNPSGTLISPQIRTFRYMLSKCCSIMQATVTTIPVLDSRETVSTSCNVMQKKGLKSNARERESIMLPKSIFEHWSPRREKGTHQRSQGSVLIHCVGETSTSTAYPTNGLTKSPRQPESQEQPEGREEAQAPRWRPRMRVDDGET